MEWRKLLLEEIEYEYSVADKVMALVDDDKLDWKPATGDNWMTAGQLIQHVATSTGPAFKGFVTGDWGFPEDFDPSKMKPEDMLPPAETLPAVGSVAEAKKLLAADKLVALEMLEKLTEEDLANKPAPAPWDPSETKLGPRLNGMVGHLTAHKNQLFYYLKLQGKPVHTGTLWGL